VGQSPLQILKSAVSGPFFANWRRFCPVLFVSPRSSVVDRWPRVPDRPGGSASIGESRWSWESAGDLTQPVGCIAISHAGHRVPFLRTDARFGGGMDGCVLMRSSNRAILQPNFRTAVSEGGNVDGYVLFRSAPVMNRPIAVVISPAHSSRCLNWTTRQASKWCPQSGRIGTSWRF